MALDLQARKDANSDEAANSVRVQCVGCGDTFTVHGDDACDPLFCMECLDGAPDVDDLEWDIRSLRSQDDYDFALADRLELSHLVAVARY